MTIFRVHFTGGTTSDVDADTPDQARKIAKTDGKFVAKVKIVKEKADG